MPRTSPTPGITITRQQFKDFSDRFAQTLWPEILNFLNNESQVLDTDPNVLGLLLTENFAYACATYTLVLEQQGLDILVKSDELTKIFTDMFEESFRKSLKYGRV